MREPVGTTRPAARPARAKTAANSSAVRSRPPVTTSMFTSITLIGSGALPGGTTVSATRTRPPGAIARRQLTRMRTASSSDQSCKDLLHEIGVRALGYRLEEVAGHQLAARQWPAEPGLGGRDAGGRIEEDAFHTYVGQGCRQKAAVPTAHIDHNTELAELVAGGNGLDDVAAQGNHRCLKQRGRLGFCASQSKRGSPKTSSKLGRPVRTASSSRPHARNGSRPIMRRKSRGLPDASARSASLSGVCAKVPDASSAKMPSAASRRIRRRRALGSVPVAAASASTVCGPAARNPRCRVPPRPTATAPPRSQSRS